MTPLDFITQYWTILGTIGGGIAVFAVLQRDVKQLETYIVKHEKVDSEAHQETARRVDRIEEANMMNAQSNAVLSANIVNLKEQLIDMKHTFKEEMTSFRNMLESLLRDQKK